MTKIISSSIAVLTLAAASQATIVDFDLTGTAGAGLLFLNEPSVLSGGTGGEIGAGIFYDDVLNLLTVNVGWGSGNGFTNLTGLVTNQHIHGPTALVNGNGFTQTASPANFNNLTLTTNTLTGGSIVNVTNTIPLTAAQETQLLNGQFYLNLHTGTNGGGEVRGFLVPAPVPEPASFSLAALGALTLLRRHRRA